MKLPLNLWDFYFSDGLFLSAIKLLVLHSSLGILGMPNFVCKLGHLRQYSIILFLLKIPDCDGVEQTVFLSIASNSKLVYIL